jgi:O-antigen/teichoic acid export membrane protein
MVPFNLVFKVTGVASSFGSAFFPALSALCTAGKRDQAAALLERTQRHLIFVLLPPISFIFVAGSQFLSAWIGPDFSQHGSVPLRLLALAFLLNCVCSLDAIALDAVGRPDLTARQVAIAGATNIVVGAPLVYTFGVVGAAATLLVSMLVLAGGVWWAAVSQELIPDLPRRLRRTLARPIGLVAPITFALYLIAPSMKGLLSLVGTGAAYALVCYALLFFLTFESEDRATVEKLLVNMGMAWIPRVRPGV